MGGLGTRSGPAAWIAVAALALVAAVGGTALAGDPAVSNAVSKKKVKRIAAKQVNKLAPELSVAHAATADSATNADRATTADTATIGGPVAFGLVDCTIGSDCEVIAAESRGLADSMVIRGGEGTACFNVPFTFRAAQVTVDLGLGQGDHLATYTDGDPEGLCPPAFGDATVNMVGADPVAQVNSAFHIAFYR